MRPWHSGHWLGVLDCHAGAREETGARGGQWIDVNVGRERGIEAGNALQVGSDDIA